MTGKFLIAFTFAVLVPLSFAMAEAADYGLENKLEKTRQIYSAAENGSPAVSWKTQPDAEIGGSFLRMFQALGLCIAVLLIGLHFYKKFHPQAPKQFGKSMRVVERLPIGPKSSLVLAEVNGQRIVLAVGSENIKQVMFSADANATNVLDLGLEQVCQEDVTSTV